MLLFEHISPNTVLIPACEALEDTVPLSISVRQFTPLGTGAQNPVNCLNKTATLFLLPCVGTRVSLQKCVQFLPLMVGNSLSRHPTIVAIVTKRIKRQRDLSLVGVRDEGLVAVKQVFGRCLFGSPDGSGFCLLRGRVGGKTLTSRP